MKERSLGLAAWILLLAGCATEAAKRQPTPEELMARYDWATSYPQGLDMARMKGKPVVLYFYHGRSWASRQLIVDALKDERVQELLAQFVLIGLNIDLDPDTALKYGVRGVPDVRFLNTDGKEIGRLSDRSPAEIAAKLEEVLIAARHAGE